MAIERIEFKRVMTSRVNVFHVPAKQWKCWSPAGRQVFNELFSTMIRNAEFFNHPQEPKMSNSHWKTVCWNAAWTAAGASDDARGTSEKVIQRIAKEAAPTIRRLAAN